MQLDAENFCGFCECRRIGSSLRKEQALLVLAFISQKETGVDMARNVAGVLYALRSLKNTVAIFGGDGLRDAREEVIELAARLKAPVGYALRGKQWLEQDNPYAVPVWYISEHSFSRAPIR